MTEQENGASPPWVGVQRREDTFADKSFAPFDPRYTGQAYDLETGLYYYQARYYNPVLARFIQPDTIVADPTDPQAFNRYAYVRNNPLKYVDPTGQQNEIVICDGCDDTEQLTDEQVHAFLEEDLREAYRDLVVGPHDSGGLLGNTTEANHHSSLGALPTEVALTFTGSPGFSLLARPAAPHAGWLDALQLGLDVAGLAPVVGEPLDLLNAGISALRGDLLGAGLSLGAAIPVVGMGATIGKLGGRIGKIGSGSTEVVQRAMSRAELEATKHTGFFRGGRIGTPEHPHFASPSVNRDPLRARERLSLDYTPEFRVRMEVPAGNFSPASRIDPKYGMPGGGLERTATGKIPANIIEFQEYFRR